MKSFHTSHETWCVSLKHTDRHCGIRGTEAWAEWANAVCNSGSHAASSFSCVALMTLTQTHECTLNHVCIWTSVSAVLPYRQHRWVRAHLLSAIDAMRAYWVDWSLAKQRKNYSILKECFNYRKKMADFIPCIQLHNWEYVEAYFLFPLFL